MLSTAATWIQAGVMLLAVSPTLAAGIAPGAVAGAAVAAATGLWRARQAPDKAAAGTEDVDGRAGPLRVRAALLVAAILVAVALAVRGAQSLFGDAGVLAGAALGALADAHASVASLGTLHAAGRIDDALALRGVLLAIAANSVTRTLTAGLAGGAAYAGRIGGSLAASGLAAAIVWWVS
jgi:uncharacterized membrane protein (DUF4010 family)